VALGAVLDDLGLETLEELGEEVVPAGKHQETTFDEVLQSDRRFCDWICKEPRKGWMANLKVYIEAKRLDEDGAALSSAHECHDAVGDDAKGPRARRVVAQSKPSGVEE